MTCFKKTESRFSDSFRLLKQSVDRYRHRLLRGFLSGAGATKTRNANDEMQMCPAARDHLLVSSTVLLDHGDVKSSDACREILD